LGKLLIECSTRGQHPNVALLKASSYFKKKGKKVYFFRGPLPANFDSQVDEVFFSIIFSYYKTKNQEVFRSLERRYSKDLIKIGGPYPSLCPERVYALYGIHPHIGSADWLENEIPDYSLVDDRKHQGRALIFTSRGCSNRCSFCIVSSLEPKCRVIDCWKDHILPSQNKITIYDNNILSQKTTHIDDVFRYIYDRKLKATFDNGFDCRFFNKSIAEIISKINNESIRFAFDSINNFKHVERSLDLIDVFNLPKSKIKFYVLYNNNDTLEDTITRCDYLIQRGVTPYLQSFRPLTMESIRDPYIDNNWSLSNIRKVKYFYSISSFYRKMSFYRWQELGCPTLRNSKVNFNCN
jgi:hypothetical protein